MDVPTRLRCTLQDLGPTFVKLGQVLATRVDLLPPAWIDELGKLQNAVPALRWDAGFPSCARIWVPNPKPYCARGT